MRQPRPGRLIGKACNNRGARATLAVIRASEHKTIPRWCEAKEVPYVALVARLKGQRKTYPLGLLKRVEVVTGGAVPAGWWLETAEAEEGSRNGQA